MTIGERVRGGQGEGEGVMGGDGERSVGEEVDDMALCLGLTFFFGWMLYLAKRFLSPCSLRNASDYNDRDIIKGNEKGQWKQKE